MAAPVPSVSTINTCKNDLGLGKNFANDKAWSMTAAHWTTTVTAPHYISDDNPTGVATEASEPIKTSVFKAFNKAT